MAIVIRRSKPITIKRRPKPERETTHHSDSRLGEGWPYERGYPPDRTKAAHHAIDVHGTIQVFLWNPRGRLGEEWTCGRWSCSPGVLGSHDYKGECTIVYRSPSTPDDDYRPSRRR